MSYLSETTGNGLHDMIVEAGMTTDDIAEILGMHPVSVKRMTAQLAVTEVMLRSVKGAIKGLNAEDITAAGVRKDTGATQQDLADAVGVSVQTIQSWEHGRTALATRHRYALAYVLQDLSL